MPKKSNSTLLTLVFLLLFVPVSTAQQLNVFHAVFLDAVTENPIKNAHVYTSSHHAAVSDETGSVRLWVHHSDTLFFSCVGYDNVSIIAANSNYVDNTLTFKVQPKVITLDVVEVFTPSIVIKPEDEINSVDIMVPDDIKFNPTSINISEDVQLNLERRFFKNEIPVFGTGIVINGLIEALTKRKHEDAIKIEVNKEEDERTSIFYGYVYSEELKKILMEQYDFTESEYFTFISIYVGKAGKIKYSDNEYSILEDIIDKL